MSKDWSNIKLNANKDYEYLSTRGFSMRVSIKDHLPNIASQLSQVAMDAAKQTAERARATYEGVTPKKTGKMREQVQIVGYKNGLLSGTVYVRWNATNPKDNFHYPYMQETFPYVNYTTPGTDMGFMQKTHDMIEQEVGNDIAEATQGLIRDESV